MASQRHLVLNVNFTNPGNHAAAWLAPELASEPGVGRFGTISHYVDTAKKAEAAGLDAIFISDSPSLSESSLHFRPTLMFDPLVALALVAAETRNLGLICTVSSSFTDPFTIARAFASLDHASGGRVAVNIVTNTANGTAQNFSQDQIAGREARYARAAEFTYVLKQLWASWAPDAILADRDQALFYRPGAVQPIHHKGAHFSVRGPLTVPASPQGRPVIFQAGASEGGRDLAVRHADAVFCVAHSLDAAEALRADFDARSAALGRRDPRIRLMPGLMLVIGSTDEEARKRQAELDALVPLSIGYDWLEGNLGVSLRHLDPDGPLPEGLGVPQNASASIAAELIETARRHGLSIRQLIQRQGSGGTVHGKLVGGPETIADHMEAWFRSGAVDGFNLNFDVLPTGVERFGAYVMPELRRRGIARGPDPADGPVIRLRDRLGL